MNKNYILISAAAILASACNQAELDKSKKQNDSLLTIINEREASLTDFVISFNEVERNLDSVAERQNIIVLNSDENGELKATQKSRINAEIEAINKLMEKNSKTIAELINKQKNSLNKNKELEKMIFTLNNQLVLKQIELTELNIRLKNLDTEVAELKNCVDTLIRDSNAKSITIANDTRSRHTAYYVTGKSKELQEANIIDRKGGLLGMGKTSKLSPDIDNTKFTQIDYTQITTIAINGAIKIITTHPTDSYELDMDPKVKNLVLNILITNPEKFWSASKYLVVVKD
jgi:DNA repair exonuclease SbcCD ATPase subunit